MSQQPFDVPRARRYENVAGRRADLGKQFFRSKMEANYARYLTLLKQFGAVLDWSYEPETFWFDQIKRGITSYKPDFKVQYRGEASAVFVEVKGYMDAKSKTKIKRFRKYFPQHRLEIVGEREYAGIKRRWRGAIPLWE